MYKNKIYVFGGFGEHPNFEAASEVYDPALNKWSLLASMPSGKAVSHQSVVLIDDKIWHIGGRAVNADGPVTNQVLIYNIPNNTWTNGPQLKDPATGQALPLGAGGAALIGRTLHVFGGFGPTICIDQNKYHLTLDVDKWLANPQSTSWENKLAPMPIPRNHLSTTVLGGKIYALGGQFGHDCNGADKKYCHVYDPITDTWTQLTNLPLERSHAEAATFAMDGKIYMAGGQGTTGGATDKVYVLTPEGNNGLGSWTTATQFQLPNLYYGISAKVVGSKFIISHGALKNITNERKETYTASITRKTPYKLGFLANCFTKTVGQAGTTVIKNLLFTIEGEKQYSLSSSASWLKITKNATGRAIPSGVDIEATINTSGLAIGNYTATVTATGTGTGTAFTAANFCVNLRVGSGTAGYTLSVAVIGSGKVTKNPNQTSYASGSKVTLSATPASGYRFSGWSGSSTGTANPLTVTMNSNKNITANFASVLGQQVVRYNLINANTDQVIQTIADGAILNLSSLPTKNLNIQVITNPTKIGSVEMALTSSGKSVKSVTENTAPYALYGDDNGNYKVWTPAAGSYTLTATPYTGSGGGGTAGAALKINFTVVNQQSSALVTNIKSTTGRNYTLAELVVGTTVYSDRTYKVTSVPASLNRAPFIKTPNDDKKSTSTGVFSFQLNQDATVYVGYDPRATALPAWLSGWRKLTSKVGIEDPDISSLTLYSKSFTAGTVTLGGNMASPATRAQSNYIVVVQAVSALQASNTANLSLSATPGTEAQLSKLEIYPNPVKGDKVFVAVNDFANQETVTLTLHDVLGRVVASKTVVTDNRGAAQTEISIAEGSLKQSVYIIRAHTPSTHIQKKVLIE